MQGGYWRDTTVHTLHFLLFTTYDMACYTLHYASQSVNKAMQKEKVELVVGVLDIYGFEIFMVS